MVVLGLQTEILETVYCLIVHLSFVTLHNPLFFSFCKTWIKTFSVFLSFFLGKLPKSQSLKLSISRTAWRILGLILQDFERSFKWNQLVLALHFSLIKSDDLAGFIWLFFYLWSQDIQAVISDHSICWFESLTIVLYIQHFCDIKNTVAVACLLLKLSFRSGVQLYQQPMTN